MSKDEKLLNFLFPSDIIKMEINSKIREFLEINCEELYLRVSSVSYDRSEKNMYIDLYPIYIMFLHTIKLVVNYSEDSKGKLSVYIEKVDILSPSPYPSIFIDLSPNMIELVERGTYSFKNFSLCTAFCILSKKGVCKGNDKDCECYSNTLLLSIGDNVKLRGSNSDVVYTINSISIINDKVLDYEIISSDGVRLARQSTQLILFKKNSITILSSPCKSCFLESCCKCELENLRNLNIL